MARGRKKKRSPAFLASLGCGLAGLAVLVCGGGLSGAYALWSRQLMGVPPYGDGLRAAAENIEAQAILGAPIRSGWWVWGWAGDDTVTLRVPLDGRSQDGVLEIAAHRSGAAWDFDTLALTADDGQQLDLRAAAPRSVPGASRTDRRIEVVAAQEAGSLDEALALASALVTDHPRWAPGWTVRGLVQLDRGALDAAAADLAQALSLDPDELDAQVGVGRIQLAREQWADCEATFTGVMQYRSHDAALWLDRARCTEGTGDLRMAVAGARQACTLGSAAGCEMAERLR